MNPWLFSTLSIPSNLWLTGYTMIYPLNPDCYYIIHPLNLWLFVIWSIPWIPDCLLHDPSLISLTGYTLIHPLNPDWLYHDLSLESLIVYYMIHPLNPWKVITWSIPWIPYCYCLVKKFSFKISFLYLYFLLLLRS